jgi:hypothetical protein
MLASQPFIVGQGGSLCSMAHDEFIARVPMKAASKVREHMLDVIESTGWKGARQMFSVPMRGEGYVRQRWTT